MRRSMTSPDTPPLVAPAPLASTAARLRSGELPLLEYIDSVCDRVDAVDPHLRAVLPERGRRERLLREAEALLQRHPDPAARPPLFGVPSGVKDIINVDGFPTRGGSALPPELFAGPEADCVRRLRDAGALVLGKTASTEFAYFAPTATTNPHDPTRTPGGSSSGSAAAVGAGLVPLALGSQTVGSVIRPASYCGAAAFKPSFGRVPTTGVIACSPSYDQIGCITQDAAGLELAASVLCDAWQSPDRPADARAATLAVPVGPYLEQAERESRQVFEEQLARLEAAGCTIRRIPALRDIDAIRQRHVNLMAAEFAQVHDAWFREYGALYRPHAATLIETGRAVSADELSDARASGARVRDEIESLMREHGIDAWISPTTTDPAPDYLAATGNPGMNLPWTHTGQPVVTLPAGASADGLPLGLQLVAAFGNDESLLGLAQAIEALL